MIQELNYYLPDSLNDVYTQLQNENHKPLAGATDIIPRLRRSKQPVDTLVDISRLAGLDFIREVDGVIQIGALATHRNVIEAGLLQNLAVSLTEAAASIGCPQTRNRGTLGGNIANASPAADTLPPLLIHDAVVHLGSMHGERTLPLSQFLQGPGKTGLEIGELILYLSLQKLPCYGSAFVKLGKRNGMAISVASAAVACTLDSEGRFSDVRIALGSVAPTAVRSPHAEQILAGEAPGEDLFAAAQKAVQLDISPIDDVRSSADYRRTAAATLLVEALRLALRRVEK